jgi:hypothetical protein
MCGCTVSGAALQKAGDYGVARTVSCLVFRVYRSPPLFAIMKHTLFRLATFVTRQVLHAHS